MFERIKKDRNPGGTQVNQSEKIKAQKFSSVNTKNSIQETGSADELMGENQRDGLDPEYSKDVGVGVKT